MPLINCESSLDLTRSKKRVIFFPVVITEFKVTGKKLCVPIATLSAEHNIKLLM